MSWSNSPQRNALERASHQARLPRQCQLLIDPLLHRIGMNEKKRKMQVKKVFDRCDYFSLLRFPAQRTVHWLSLNPFKLKKECKSDAIKFQGSPKVHQN
ncbi:hypothetical protein BYT27DRAFT_6867343 [Phlegmacium glaucopus]|nr:hypothetical protein BYT27DRAFT_6867343 [Phlegmacium glaucopus]